MQRLTKTYKMLNNQNSKFYDPFITTADIEVWLNVSNATARRLMKRMKEDLELPKYKRPLRSVARSYFFHDK